MVSHTPFAFRYRGYAPRLSPLFPLSPFTPPLSTSFLFTSHLLSPPLSSSFLPLPSPTSTLPSPFLKMYPPLLPPTLFPFSSLSTSPLSLPLPLSSPHPSNHDQARRSRSRSHVVRLLARSCKASRAHSCFRVVLWLARHTLEPLAGGWKGERWGGRGWCETPWGFSS